MSGPAGPFASPRAGGARPWIAGLASALLTIVAVAAFVGLLAVWIDHAPGPRARTGAATTVVLRKGAHLYEIATDLQHAGVVRSAPIFMAAVQVSRAGHALKAGEYAFPSRASLAQVIGRIRSGEVVHHRLTVPEGVPSRQAMDILNHCEVLTGSAPTPPEGAILPETYEVVRGESRATVLQRMMDADDRVLAQLWDRRRPDLPFANVEQAVVLASIVERETALPAERPKIAAVYINRLRKGVKLEADPTVIYGLTQGAPLGHGLRQSELQSNTPFNTYVNLGLPPTPIDNPGRASLAAVMDPTPTDALYFVADGTGGHVFSASLAEHQKNVARWRRIEQQRAAAGQAQPTRAGPGQGLAGVPVPARLEHR